MNCYTVLAATHLGTIGTIELNGGITGLTTIVKLSTINLTSGERVSIPLRALFVYILLGMRRGGHLPLVLDINTINNICNETSTEIYKNSVELIASTTASSSECRNITIPFQAWYRTESTLFRPATIWKFDGSCYMICTGSNFCFNSWPIAGVERFVLWRNASSYSGLYALSILT